MLYNESLWIKKNLKHLGISKNTTVLDIGSNTLMYRKIVQPYIDRNVFEPLRRKGCEIFYADKKNIEGVDIVFDIEKESINDKFDIVLCNNLLEHVNDIKRVSEKIMQLVKKGGYLLVSVPFLFPLHYDPIDNGFRPSAKELANLFPNQKIIKAEIIKDRKQKEKELKYKVSLVLLKKSCIISIDLYTLCFFILDDRT